MFRLGTTATSGTHYCLCWYWWCRALYERDTRRPFCPPSLWLEPYNRLVSASGQQQPLSGAAVVRALLAAADDGEGEGGAQQQGRLPAAARAAAAAATAASRPAAVAAILMAAPQCCPFEERLAVFRALIEADKARQAPGLRESCFAQWAAEKNQLKPQPLAHALPLTCPTLPGWSDSTTKPHHLLVMLAACCSRSGYHLSPVDGGARPVPLTIRREHVLGDAVAQAGVPGLARVVPACRVADLRQLSNHSLVKLVFLVQHAVA
jgi:hypothetical protein